MERAVSPHVPILSFDSLISPCTHTHTHALPCPQNVASKNELSKDQVRLKQQIDKWKEQAGLLPHQYALVDLAEITDERLLDE